MKYVFSLFFCSFISFAALGQQLSVKTNLLYDASATFNLGVEIGLGKQTSLDISGNYNNWAFPDNKKWKQWMIQPELRYKLFKRFGGNYRTFKRFSGRYGLHEEFSGHFFGLHLLVGQFNCNRIKLPFGMYPGVQDYNYQGDLFGGGLSYGYLWIFRNHWGLEATIGAGYINIKYDQYPCFECGEKLGSGTENYWGLTKIGISLIYFIF